MMFRFIGQNLKILKKYDRMYSMLGFSPSLPVVPCTKVSSLSNGMRVATEESESPLACVSLFVEVGPVNETPANYGITHLIEHVAFRGFKSMGKKELEDYLLTLGAKVSVLTTREFQVFSAKCPAEVVTDLATVLSKVVTELELLKTEVDMAKCMIELESIDSDRNPKLVVSDYLHEAAFQCTPLGRRIIGPTKILKKLDKIEIECYMKEFYYPSRFVLATSGAVDHEKMVSCAQSCFGKMDPTRRVNSCPPQRYTGSQICYRDDSMPFVYVAIAVEAPSFGSEDYLMMLVASNILGSWSKSQGGHDRHASALARAASTSCLCDHFEPFYIAYRDVGLWGMYMVSEKMDIDDMIINLQDRWMHLCTTTVYNDVERAVNTTKLEIAKSIEGSVKSCYDIGMQLLYTCGRRSLPQIYQQLSRANEKNIKRLANAYIYERCPVVSAVGPTEGISEYTRIRAGMYWLRV